MAGNFEIIDFNPDQTFLPFYGFYCNVSDCPCTAYGYGQSQDVSEENSNTIHDGSIISKVAGTAHYEKFSPFATMSVALQNGMSGGPWMVNNNSVFGIQATSFSTKSYSPSIFLNKDFFGYI